MNDTIDAIAQAFLDHQAMEETRSYLERGRRFERLSVEDLNKGWAVAFTAVSPRPCRRHEDRSGACQEFATRSVRAADGGCRQVQG